MVPSISSVPCFAERSRSGADHTRLAQTGELGNHQFRPAIATPMIFGVILQSWTDIRLSWNPKEHGNVLSVRLPITEIWSPDIHLYNRLGSISPVISPSLVLMILFHANNGSLLNKCSSHLGGKYQMEFIISQHIPEEIIMISLPYWLSYSPYA